MGSSLVGTYGTLTLYADGHYTYVANNANALASGATATDTFTYTLSDAQGASDKAELAITVTGTNDVPVTVGTIANLAQVDSTAVSIATAGKFSDVDSTDVLTYSATTADSASHLVDTTVPTVAICTRVATTTDYSTVCLVGLE